MHKELKIVLICLTLLLVGKSKGFAQQNFINGFYMFNPLGFNPGIVGTDDRLMASAIYRNQWTDMPGAPKTIYANVHSPLANFVSRKRKRHLKDFPTGLSLGLTFAKDDIGANNLTMVALPIGVRVRLNRNGDRLSFGIKPLLNCFSADYSELNADAGDPLGVNWSHTFVDFDLGWYWYNTNYYAGFSIANVREINVIKEYGYYQKRHYFLSAGYAFFFDDNWMLRTTALAVGTKHAPVSVTVSPTMIYKQKLFLGAAYRHKDMVGANVGLNILPNLRAHYAYEYPIGSKVNRVGHTHEILLTYEFVRYRNQVVSPRYFW